MTQLIRLTAFGLLALFPITASISYRSTVITVGLVGICAILMLLRTGVAKSVMKQRQLKILVVVAIVSIGWVGISIAWATEYETALRTATKIAGITTAGILAICATEQLLPRFEGRYKDAVVTIFFLAGFGLVILFFMMEHKPNHHPVLPTGEKILLSWFNAVSAVLLIWSWLIAYLCREDSPFLSFGAVGLAFVVAVLYGFGAGIAAALIGFAVATVCFVLGARGIWLVGAGCLIVILSLPFLSQQFPSYDAAENGMSIHESVGHRILIWRFTSDRILEKPIIGWGVGASRTIPGGDVKRDLVLNGVKRSLDQLPLHPHNAVLQVWLELGSVGVAILAGITGLLTVYLMRMRASRLEQGLMLGAIAVGFVIMSVSFSIWSSWWLSALFLFSLMFIAVVRRQREKSAC